MSDDDDLEFIRACVLAKRIFWTYHVNIRLKLRDVGAHDVTESVSSYRVIERYEHSQASRYLPSALIYAEREGEVLHILFAMDRNGGHVRVITVYRPDEDRWESDFMTRRRQ